MMKNRIQINDGVYELKDGDWIYVGSIWTVYPHGNTLQFYTKMPPAESLFAKGNN